MIINGSVTDALREKSYTAENYGAGWYGANAAKRQITSGKLELGIEQNQVSFLRYTPAADEAIFAEMSQDVTVFENTMGYSKSLIRELEGTTATGLTPEGFLTLFGLGNEESVIKRAEKTVELVLEGLKPEAERYAEGNPAKEAHFYKTLRENKQFQDKIYTQAEIFIRQSERRFRNVFQALDINANQQLDVPELSVWTRWMDGVDQLTQKLMPQAWKAIGFQKTKVLGVESMEQALPLKPGEGFFDQPLALDGQITPYEQLLAYNVMYQGDLKSLRLAMKYMLREWFNPNQALHHGITSDNKANPPEALPPKVEGTTSKIEAEPLGPLRKAITSLYCRSQKPSA